MALLSFRANLPSRGEILLEFLHKKKKKNKDKHYTSYHGSNLLCAIISSFRTQKGKSRRTKAPFVPAQEKPSPEKYTRACSPFFISLRLRSPRVSKLSMFSPFFWPLENPGENEAALRFVRSEEKKTREKWKKEIEKR